MSNRLGSTLYHIILSSEGKCVLSINVRASSEREALASAKLQYPFYEAEVTMTCERWSGKECGKTVR